VVLLLVGTHGGRGSVFVVILDSSSWRRCWPSSRRQHLINFASRLPPAALVAVPLIGRPPRCSPQVRDSIAALSGLFAGASGGSLLGLGVLLQVIDSEA
jgi:hypothetical protein